MNIERKRPQKPNRLPPLPPTKINEMKEALKGHAKPYDIEIQHNLNPLNHFMKINMLVELHLQGILETMKEFKFIETVVVTFKKGMYDPDYGERVTAFRTAYFSCTAKTITKSIDIKHELNVSMQEMLDMIDKWVSEGSGCIIDSVDNHYLNVTQYQPLNGSSYIELPLELRNSSKGLINLKIDDDECFRWCHIKHLNPQIKNPQRIRKEDKQLIGGLNYTNVEFPVC